MKKIIVVGSSNYDLITYTQRFVLPKETLRGTSFEMGFGGKGANQACIAQKLGSSVSMVTKLGKDIFGNATLENFKVLGMECSGVFIDEKIASGVAQITVETGGENCIIIVPGANESLTFEELESTRPLFESAQLLMCQNEISLNMTLKALEMGKASGLTTVYNPAPICEEAIAENILTLVDVLVVNEVEVELLLEKYEKRVHKSENALLDRVKVLQEQLKCVLILTLGGSGVVVFENGGVSKVEPTKVEAVDTTGAGDCFIGSFSHFYLEEGEILKAVEKASKVAALSVTKNGTQKSYPTREEAYEFIDGGK